LIPWSVVSRRSLILAAMLLGTGAAGLVFLRSGGAARPPADPVALSPASARTQVLNAIDGFVDGGAIRLEAEGGQEGAERVTLSGEIDRAGGRGTWTETTPTASGNDVIAQTIVVDGVTYSRIYFSNEAPTAFTRIDDPSVAGEMLDGAFTVGSKLTDSLGRVRRMVAEVPFQSFALGTTTRANRAADGISAQFRTGDVYDWLSATGLETVDGARPTDGATVMQFWIADGVLVGFDAREDGFQDGELLHDHHFDVTYEPIGQASVSIPAG
jgi:hypothetical protein